MKLTVVFLFGLSSCVNSYIVSCYYRYHQRNIRAEALDSEGPEAGPNCTHLIVGFATVGHDYKLNLTDVGELDGLTSFVKEGKPTPTSKIMLSIGGGGGSKTFELMVLNSTRREIFIRSLMDTLRHTSLDGIDYDWEFPGIFQFNQFANLLHRTREILDAEGILRTGNFSRNRTLQLSLALPGPLTLTAGYDAKAISETCDFLNVMTYDLILYDSWRPQAALHNALYGQGIFFNPLRLFSVATAMSTWEGLGIPKDKLLLGLPTYGVAYQLENATRSKLFAEVTGYSPLGSNVNYDDICKMISEYPEGVSFDTQSRVPYFTDGKGNWISYDNANSIAEKVEFAIENEYGGIMIFSLNADDPRGSCSSIENSDSCGNNCVNARTPYPLSKIAIAALQAPKLKE